MKHVCANMIEYDYLLAEVASKKAFMNLELTYLEQIESNLLLGYANHVLNCITYYTILIFSSGTYV